MCFIIFSSHLYLDEVSSYVFKVCGGDGFFMLRNKLQALQYFVLRPTEVWAAKHIHKWTDLLSYKGTKSTIWPLAFSCVSRCCINLCRRAVVMVTAMFSHAAVLSPLPGAAQPSRLQHSSNTQDHLWPAGTTYWPSLLYAHTHTHTHKPFLTEVNSHVLCRKLAKHASLKEFKVIPTADCFSAC